MGLVKRNISSTRNHRCSAATRSTHSWASSFMWRPPSGAERGWAAHPTTSPTVPPTCAAGVARQGQRPWAEGRAGPSRPASGGRPAPTGYVALFGKGLAPPAEFAHKGATVTGTALASRSLVRLAKGLAVEATEQEPLAPKTSLRVGGAAELFVRPLSPDAVVALLRRAEEMGLPLNVLG